jgi:hypothetical protein
MMKNKAYLMTQISLIFLFESPSVFLGLHVISILFPQKKRLFAENFSVINKNLSMNKVAYACFVCDSLFCASAK